MIDSISEFPKKKKNSRQIIDEKFASLSQKLLVGDSMTANLDIEEVH